MNILFLTSSAPEKAAFSTNEKRPPLGLGFLMAVLKKEGHKVYFSDEYLQPSSILDSNFLEVNDIDYVGIYSNTICYKSTLDMFNKLQGKRDEGLWTGKIMVGGPHTSIGNSEIPDFVDHIVIGEGEITVPKIISGEITERCVNGEKVDDLDSLPMPSWEEFIYRPYQWKHDWLDAYPIYTMNTSRGCPFNCTFCSVNAIWGRTYSCMSARKVVEDIEYLIKYYGARAIYFREDHFTLNKNRTVEFCELLLKKNIDIEWMCETRVDQLGDYEFQKLMKLAGCKVFYIGVESGSPRMLEFFKKGETIDQFIKAFEIAHRLSIKTYASFVVAAPTETQRDRDMTDHFIQKVQPDFVGKNIYVGLPGSELYDYMKNNDLYEYEDEFHILYPLGYLKNVDIYYKENEYFKTYTLNKSPQKISTFVHDKIKKFARKYPFKIA
jgi:O-antigen biosynthesis protein